MDIDKSSPLSKRLSIDYQLIINEGSGSLFVSRVAVEYICTSAGDHVISSENSAEH